MACGWRVPVRIGPRTSYAQLATEVLGEFGGGGGLRVSFRTRAVAAGRALPGEVVTVTADGLGEYDDPASTCLARTLIPDGTSDPQAELSLPLERLPGLKAALLSCTAGKSHKK